LAQAAGGSSVLRCRFGERGGSASSASWRRAIIVEGGDRIEIYRPLLEEPKLARRKQARAQKNALAPRLVNRPFLIFAPMRLASRLSSSVGLSKRATLSPSK